MKAFCDAIGTNSSELGHLQLNHNNTDEGMLAFFSAITPSNVIGPREPKGALPHLRSLLIETDMTGNEYGMFAFLHAITNKALSELRTLSIHLNHFIKNGTIENSFLTFVDVLKDPATLPALGVLSIPEDHRFTLPDPLKIFVEHELRNRNIVIWLGK